jgi:hypothetical protein|tara:strand:+ start:287 stop:973 length:687 start_codon:yes stop_codon:yes gene_type:complete
MISLAQPMMGMGMAPMQRRRDPQVPQIQKQGPSPLGMAVDLAETKAIDYALGQVGKEGAKKALAAAGGAMGGPLGAMAGEIGGELLAPFLKSLFFARGGYIGPLGMETGGKVPSKFKGFAKLPEAVQQKISPDLAKKYDMGGRVSGPPMSAESMMFSGKGMTPMGIDSEDYFKSLMKSGKLPLGAGYSVKPDAGKGSGSLTLEYEISKDPSRNMMTGIKNMFNNFRGR